MSYTPTVWANGDTITATKLNKMENGIADAGSGGGGGGALIVTATSSEGQYGTEWTCDKTAAEMWTAFLSGVVIIMMAEDLGVLVSSAYGGQSGYGFYTYDGIDTDQNYSFQALLGTDYPVAN